MLLALLGESTLEGGPDFCLSQLQLRGSFSSWKNIARLSNKNIKYELNLAKPTAILSKCYQYCIRFVENRIVTLKECYEKLDMLEIQPLILAYETGYVS